jgi:uncharacterized protein YerC
MVRVSRKKVGDKMLQIMSDRLITRILRAHTVQDASLFLKELLGAEERMVFAKRLSIIILLRSGFGLYVIAQMLKVSTSTVSRVSLDIQNGRYANLITLLNKEGMGKESSDSFWHDLQEFIEAHLVYSGKKRSAFRNKIFRRMDEREQRMKAARKSR